MSLRTLKRMLKKLGLRRRLTGINGREIVAHVQRELNDSTGNNVGYRVMQAKLLRKHGLYIHRERVRQILSELDPEGLRMRRRGRLRRCLYSSKGPNFCWHVDGNDKLVPFGFAIHSCIDGFSCKILWLEVSVTNKDPRVIANYYLNAVRNMRIKQFWGVLRRWYTDWWIDFLKMLKREGCYDDSDMINRDCLRLSFMNLIQKDLDEAAHIWNTHLIRKQNGIPNDLFYLPEMRGFQNCSSVYDEEDMRLCQQHVTEKPPLASNEFFTVADLCMPSVPFEALWLYLHLVDMIQENIGL